MRNHIDHLLTAYVHNQLPRAQRDRVALHVRLCPECRAALSREEQLANDLRRNMPQIGQPRPNQLARLWPAIWSELRNPSSNVVRMLPSYGVALAMLLLCTFLVSALFAGPTHAVAAPVPRVPADILPTLTPVRTDEPAASAPQPSETASVAYLPMASPAPVVLVSNSYQRNGR